MGWGWFNSIVDGVSSAASYCVQNAGTIAGVAQAVGKVAALAAAAEGKKPTPTDDGDPIADFYPNFTSASNHLLTLAKAATHSTTKRGPTETVINQSQLLGLWRNPSRVSNDKANRDMYRDIAKWCSTSSVPLTFVDTNGATQDTAHQIALAISADDPPAPGSAAADSNPVLVPGFQLANIDGSLQINGAHAYYTLPMGKSATDNSWHSALNVETVMTKDFKKSYDAQRRSQTTTKPLNVTAGSDVWLETMSIVWDTVTAADQAVGIFAQTWQQDFSDPRYVLVYNANAGSVQTVKVQAPDSSKTPAEVRADVQRVVRETAQRLQGSTPAQDATLQVPFVYVTNSTLVVPSSSKTTANR